MVILEEGGPNPRAGVLRGGEGRQAGEGACGGHGRDQQDVSQQGTLEPPDSGRGSKDPPRSREERARPQPGFRRLASRLQEDKCCWFRPRLGQSVGQPRKPVHDQTLSSERTVLSSSKAWLSGTPPLWGLGRDALSSQRVRLLPVAGNTQVDLPRVSLLGGTGIPFILHLVRTQTRKWGITVAAVTFHVGTPSSILGSSASASERCHRTILSAWGLSPEMMEVPQGGLCGHAQGCV